MDSQLGDQPARGFEDNRPVQVTHFDFDAIDGDHPELSDNDMFWRRQAELLLDILRWLTEPKDHGEIGGRVHELRAFLYQQTTPSSELANWLVWVQRKFPRDAAYYRKVASLRPKALELRDNNRRRKTEPR